MKEGLNSACALTLQQMYFSNTQENVWNNYKVLLNNNMILNKFIKSSDKCNPTTKTYFSFTFDLRNCKQVGKLLLEALKITCEESCTLTLFQRFNFFTGALKGFFRITPKLLLREGHLSFSNTCHKFMVIFRKIVIFFPGRNAPCNKFVDVKNKETNEVQWHRCLSIMSSEKLICTWEVQQLLLALFSSMKQSQIDMILP